MFKTASKNLQKHVDQPSGKFIPTKGSKKKKKLADMDAKVVAALATEKAAYEPTFTLIPFGQKAQGKGKK